MDGILQSVANDMNRQKENTDIALTKRIAETRDAKEKLEAHLLKASYKLEIFVFARKPTLQFLKKFKVSV